MTYDIWEKSYVQKLAELRIRNLPALFFAKLQTDKFTIHIKRDTLMQSGLLHYIFKILYKQIKTLINL